MDGSENVDTKDGTTNDWLGLPCTGCPPNPVPAANRLDAESVSDGKAAGTPSEQGGVVVMALAADKTG